MEGQTVDNDQPTTEGIEGNIPWAFYRLKGLYDVCRPKGPMRCLLSLEAFLFRPRMTKSSRDVVKYPLFFIVFIGHYIADQKSGGT